MNRSRFQPAIPPSIMTDPNLEGADDDSVNREVQDICEHVDAYVRGLYREIVRCDTAAMSEKDPEVREALYARKNNFACLVRLLRGSGHVAFEND